MDQLKSGSELELALSTLSLDAKWTDKEYTLDEIAEDFELPQIAKISSPTTGSDLEKRVDIESPFLIYSRRRRSKLVAQLLYYDDKQKAWVVEGPNLEIPKDYTGWFEMVEGTDGKISRFYSACNSIAQIVQTQCRKFLVRSTVVAHRYMEDENGIVFLDEIKIFVGEILRCEGTTKRQWKVLENRNGDSTSKAPETEFLKCLDPRKNKVCISLGHPGKFNPIYDPKKGVENQRNCVYQVTDILEKETRFPKTVRLAFGWMPKLPLIPRTFQGVFQLVGLVRPDTLVLCSLVTNTIPLLEVPTNIDVRVRLHEGKDKWLTEPSSKPTLKKCYGYVYPFLTSLKIMDIKYKTRDLSKDKETPPQKSIKYGRMASPLDMKTFNPLDVYPPMIKEADIAETWTLSFRDPEHAIDEKGQVVFGDSRVVLSAENGAASRASASGTAPGQEKKRKPKGNSDLRAMRDQEVTNREAFC